MDGADASDFNVADDQVVLITLWMMLLMMIYKEAEGDISIIMINSNVSNSVINTSSLQHQNQHHQLHQEHHPHDHQPLAECGVTVSRGPEHGSKAAKNTRGAGSQKATDATRRLEKGGKKQKT